MNTSYMVIGVIALVNLETMEWPLLYIYVHEHMHVCIHVHVKMKKTKFIKLHYQIHLFNLDGIQ